jgi:hypothetical protein
MFFWAKGCPDARATTNRSRNSSRPWKRSSRGSGEASSARSSRPSARHGLDLALHLIGLRLDRLQVRQHHPPELGQMGVGPLAMEQRPAELGFQLLDLAGQRRLGDVAPLGRAREVQRARQGQEIADLLHLHGRGVSSCVLTAPAC